MGLYVIIIRRQHHGPDSPDLSMACLLVVGVKYQDIAICFCPKLLLLQPDSSVAQAKPELNCSFSVV
jgi:hypothetical protein